jgi:hypothetical protein
MVRVPRLEVAARVSRLAAVVARLVWGWLPPLAVAEVEK